MSTNAPRLLRAFLFAAAVSLVALSPSVAAAVCGDGELDGEEQCDDGNLLDFDCCAKDCTFDPVESPCTDGNQCTSDFCDGEGTCLSFPNQGAECDDGNDCTFGDLCNSDGFCTSDGFAEDFSSCSDETLCGGQGTCLDGLCLGDPADCSVFNGACNTSVCDPEKFQCTFTQHEDGSPCDNPNVCTDPGQCMSGECLQPPTDCSDFADACNDAACDVEAGGCFSVPKESGTPCDDTNGCTDPGTCDGEGTCNTTPKDCSGFADQCNDAACDPKSVDGCFALPKDNGTPCNDDSGCTVDDACTDGFCDGAPRDCSDLDDACHVGVCNGDIGDCQADLVENGTPCDDGNACTGRDECTAGQCAGTPVDCSEAGDACNIGFCNSQTGQCETTPVEAPTLCNDGDLCTTGDRCIGGLCIGGAVDCSAENGNCTVGVCNPDTGQCEDEPAEDGTSCTDGDLCTTSDECTSGECAGTPVNCSGRDGACIDGVCNPDTGQCTGTPVEDGTSCNDGDLCTTADECTDGECSGTPVNCSAESGACTLGVCNANNGQCQATPVEDGTTCNDGDLCTTADECTDGVCSGTPVNCSAESGACTLGVCNVNNGQCQATPVEDGTPCSDGVACTTGDECTDGACGGTPVDCSNLDGPCVDGACNSGSGACEAVPVEDGSPCSDNAFCTETDTCTDGVCSGTGDPCDGNPECASVCNEAADSCNAAAGTPCTPDDNVCTDDVCDGAGNCDAVANTGACDDGLFCTTGDRCSDGECIGDPACPPTHACGDTCDEEADACRICGHPFSNTRCIVNAVFVLQGALGLRECELCTCDVDSSGAVMVTDALMILRTCANLPSELECPAPQATSTTTTTTTSTTFGP